MNLIYPFISMVIALSFPLMVSAQYEHSAAPKAFTWVRAGQTNTPSEFLRIQYGIHGPDQTYLFGSAQYSSASGDVDPHLDLASFGVANHLFSPNLYGFGLVGQHFASAAPNSTQYRAGLYYTTHGKVGMMTYLLVPYVLFNDSGSKAGRSVFFYTLTYMKGLFLLDGTFAYTWREGVWSATADPALGIRIWGNFRAVVGYDHAHSNSANRDDFFTGLEFRAYY